MAAEAAPPVMPGSDDREVAPVPAPLLTTLPPATPALPLPPATPAALHPTGRRVVRLSGTDLCPSWRGRPHLVALCVAAPAGAALLDRRPTVPTALYVFGVLAMLAVSSAYHLLPCAPSARRVLRRADHATIYLCIAGSYTPLCAVALARPLGPLLQALAWGGALLGVALKVVQFERRPRVGSAGYFVLGWMVVAVLPEVAGRLDPTQTALLLAAGACYTVGAGVLFARWPDPAPDRFGYHELWHVAVVAATACYFALVWSLPAT